MIKKRAQGLSMNTIIIAALVVIVMIVLILIFTNSGGSFNRNLRECSTYGGQCVLESECGDTKMRAKCDTTQVTSPDGRIWNFASDDVVCCVEIDDEI